MLDANKQIDRLRQTVKDVRSLKNDGRGVSFDAETRLNYLLNRCSDLVRDYDREFNIFLNEMETLERQGKFKGKLKGTIKRKSKGKLK